MTEQLSSFRIKQGRRLFDAFSAVNSFSFALVTGNAITLYALALGASSTVVGLLGSFLYASFFAIPLGKLALKRMTLVRTFADTWVLRTVSLVPLLFIPFLVSVGSPASAISALVAGVFMFNFFRGVGLIANNPVIGILSPGKDRGEYIIKLSLINNVSALLSTAALASVLHWHSGIQTWNVVIIVGILTGLVASFLLYRLPDPATSRSSPPPALYPSFIRLIRDALREDNFRRFILSYLVIGLGIGMARPFVVVYCKEVYGMSDSLVTVFSVASSVGAILMGLVMRLVIDRLGAKPMYVIFAAISLASLLPALASPGSGGVSLAGVAGAPGTGVSVAGVAGGTAFAVAFLCAFAAVTNMGFAGQESAAQAYFFAMVPKESIMDLSMLYYYILGGTGAIGSVFGGALLDALSAAGLSPLASYRVFFALGALVIGFGIHLQRRLRDLGSYPVRESLAVLFSPRDMRALTLLRKLDASEDPDEETGIIAELGSIASPVSAGELLDRLSSPRFAVRYEALQSVESLDRLDSRLRDALFSELETGEFGTAALAARFLGKFGVRQAAPALRAALSSPDYRLAGEAMLALARVHDQGSQFAVRDLLLATRNPFVLVRGVQAMTEFGTAASVPILVDLLRCESLPPHVADETVLALSDLMGVPKKFYYAYEDYVRDRSRAGELLADAIDEYATRFRRDPGDLAGVIGAFIADPSADAPLSSWFVSSGVGHAGVFSALLMSVALDSGLNRKESFRFFLCFWAIAVFAYPGLIEK